MCWFTKKLIKLCTVYEKKKSTIFLNFFYFLYYIFSPPPNFLNFGVDNCHQPVYIIYTNRLFGLTAIIWQFPIDNSGRRLLNVPPGLRLTHPRCNDQPLFLAIVQLPILFLSLPGKILAVFPFFNLFLFIIYVPLYFVLEFPQPFSFQYKFQILCFRIF